MRSARIDALVSLLAGLLVEGSGTSRSGAVEGSLRQARWKDVPASASASATRGAQRTFRWTLGADIDISTASATRWTRGEAGHCRVERHVRLRFARPPAHAPRLFMLRYGTLLVGCCCSHSRCCTTTALSVLFRGVCRLFRTTKFRKRHDRWYMDGGECATTAGLRWLSLTPRSAVRSARP